MDLDGFYMSLLGDNAELLLRDLFNSFEERMLTHYENPSG